MSNIILKQMKNALVERTHLCTPAPGECEALFQLGEHGLAGPSSYPLPWCWNHRTLVPTFQKVCFMIWMPNKTTLADGLHLGNRLFPDELFCSLISERENQDFRFRSN
jgi:hypothetical protein